MSTAATTAPTLTGAPGAKAAARDPGPAVAAGGALLVAVALFFVDWFYRQHRFSWGSADWSHAYIVPFISGYVVWARRETLRALPVRVFWPGVIPLLVGVASYALFTLTPIPGIHLFQGFALVLVVAGLALLLLGPRWLPWLAFPIGYLAFMITVPEMVMNTITFKLQLIASDGAAILLKLLGYTVDLAGNTITLTMSDGREIPLNVAEACSGMRMVIGFAALGVAVAFLGCQRWWQRIALMSLAVPVALITNVVRVASLGIAATYDSELAAGDAHSLIGVLWLVPAFLLFMGILWALKNMVRGEEGS